MKNWFRKTTSDPNSRSQAPSLRHGRKMNSMSEVQEPLPDASTELAILHHSVLHVGRGEELTPPSSLVHRTLSKNASSSISHVNKEQMWLSLMEDPTIEESIECVFARQIQLHKYGLMDEILLENDDNSNVNTDTSVQSDSHGSSAAENSVQETFFCGFLTEENRDDNIDRKKSTVYIPPPQKGSLVYVGRLDLTTQNGTGDIWTAYANNGYENNTSNLSAVSASKPDSLSAPLRRCCSACLDGKNDIPDILTDHWPQSPLLLRPTPGSGTIVRGVRFASSPSFLFSNEINFPSIPPLWLKTLHPASTTDTDVSLCPECCCIPINNGNETPDETLVIDFESPLFLGTLLVRIRGSAGFLSRPYDDSVGYFKGMNRQFQAVVRGRFKKDDIPMTECVTGQIMRRPFEKTPPMMVCRGGIKVLTFFAPLLQAKMDGPNPYFLSPLGSTPQVIVVDRADPNFETFMADGSIARHLQEPTIDEKKIIPVQSSAGVSSSAMARAKARKKAFDALCASNQKGLTFKTDCIYTFEFLQHLLDYNTFEINLGSVLGKINLKDSLGGQPALLMSAHQHPFSEGESVTSSPVGKEVNGFVLDSIWSFDLWQKGLIENARQKQGT